ncbi:MAG TPA: glycine cleavage system protein GcvH [Anaerolineaceae bacterium]|nr:glycine cleavage system protein GcvH [Anaerolineaceae bacterium]HOV05829.1 glycine cleavage system protein GcvH [Anaerolineaceae bacterium]
MNTPKELKYASTDEWLKVEKNIATLGVTDYAQGQLSDIVFFEVTVDVGDQVEKNTIVATIESVKAAADVKLPVSGKVIEINEDLADKPELINSDPFGAAWMLKVELTDPAEVDALMDADAYAAFCETRGH